MPQAEVDSKKVFHVRTVGLSLWILRNNSSLFLIQSVNLIILNKEPGRWETRTIIGCDRVSLVPESHAVRGFDSYFNFVPLLYRSDIQERLEKVSLPHG